MLYTSVIAQEGIKERLRRQIVTGRVPHAQLFSGPEGCGKLPMALAFAEALLCQSPVNGNPCGECRSCKMMKRFEHPDLHFLFPNKRSSEETMSAAHLRTWREELQQSLYLDTKRWYAAMGTENQQPIINVKDAAYMSDALSLTAQQGGYRVVIIWHAELINEQAANKILKVLEEPPAKTVMILITETPERLLQTIISRTQIIEFPALTAEELQQTLVKQHGMADEMALTIARNANGSYTQAVNMIQVNEETAVFFDLFVQLMRKCYMRDIKEMHKWSELVAEWGREKQKNFLRYCQHMVRENFMFNFQQPELNYLAPNERDFSTRFSPFINERNVIGIMEELSLAERDITQNVNPRMVFFDFALKMIVLLIK